MQSDAPRFAAIINPIAGGGKAVAGWRSLREIACANGALDEYFSDYPGHATEIARSIIPGNYAMAFAVGGDGTIHEVVNGLMGQSGEEPGYLGPTFGAIPLGRGNDFARTFGIAMDPREAWVRQTNGRTGVRKVDVGWVRPADGARTHFINMCGMGFDADSAAVANRLPRILGGALPYVLGVLAGFVSLNNRPLQVNLEDVHSVPGRENPAWAPRPGNEGSQLTVAEVFLLASVGIGRYLGGGMMLLPHADPTDGLLDVMLARRVRRLRLLKILGRTFRGGHLGEPEVAYYRAREVRISGPDSSHIHADGDPVGSGAAEFGVLPGVLPVRF